MEESCTINMSSNGVFKQTPTLDNLTPLQTPCPQAASTTLHTSVPVTQKLYESMLLSTPPNNVVDQSSLGLLPCNFDGSLMNLSNLNASASILLNKTRKHSTLPSIPESPNKLSSPCVLSADSPMNDDVFEDDRQAGNQSQGENKENLTNASNHKPDVRFSISNLSKIEFRDDQISARSSTADSYMFEKSLPSPSDGTKPGTFSHLFSRHTLDVSAFTDALAMPDRNEGTIANNSNLAAPHATEDQHKKLSPNTAVDDADLNYFQMLGQDSERLNNVSVNSEEFVSGANFLAVLEKDEEVFDKDTALLIPENAFGNGSVVIPDQCNEVALRTSWLSAVNRQDITRPSWYSSEENAGNASRISIGEFIRARTESLGIGPEETVSSNVERPNFGVPEITSPKKTEGPPLLPPAIATTVRQPDNMDFTWPSTLNVVNEGLMSSSAMSLLFSDVPLDLKQYELANKLLQAGKSKGGQNPAHPEPASMPRHNDTSIEFSASFLPGLSESVNVGRKDCVDKSVQASRSLCNAGGGDGLSSSGKSSVVLRSSVGLKPLMADQQDIQKSVSFPNEVIIETPCCVETPTETVIALTNSSARWLEGSVRLLRLTCDGENVNVGRQPPIVSVDSSWAMEPNAPHSLTVVVVPPKKGRWEAVLQPFFRYLSASKATCNWYPFKNVTIKVVAEDANFSTTPADNLDFGLLPEECLVVSHILVANHGEAQLPIRLTIEGCPAGGQGFYFPQENVNSSSMMRGTSSCISRRILVNTCPTVKVPVAFKAPTLPHAGHGIVTVSAFLRIELEIPGPAPLLKKISLKAFVSPVKLCTLPEDETIELTYPAASSRRFPLANVGAIPLNLELFTDAPQELTVLPMSTELMPGQEIDVQLLYHPTDLGISLQSFLKIKVIPEGSVYKIAVVGNPPSRPQSALSSSSGNQSLLQSNRRFVYWGAVGLGHRELQQFTLRNVSQAESLFLHLKIKSGENDSNAGSFQLADEELSGSSSASASLHPPSRLSSHCNITLNPGESRVIKLNFLPGNPGLYSATLVIRHRHSRQQGGASNTPRLKFHIPLRGIGGVAVLEFDGLHPTKISSAAHINVQTSSGQHTIVTCEHNNTICSLPCEPLGGVSHFVARNRGPLAAFVKIVTSSDKASIVPLPNWLSVIVQPSEFVLQEGGSCPIKVCVQPHSSSATAFYIIICYGENILRQRFRMLPLPLCEHPEDILLRTQLEIQNNFQNDIPSNSAGPQWPACQADRSQLITSLKIQWVLVQPTVRDSQFRLPSVRLNSASDLEDNSAHGTFFPLEAEVTFSDITVLPNSIAPQSPPSKEKPSSVRENEGTLIVEPTSHVFQPVPCGQSSKFKVTLKSIGYSETVTVTILQTSAPFHINYQTVTIKPNHYLSVPVVFRPTTPGVFSSTLLLHPRVGTGAQTLAVSLQGEAV